jgi:hypothetical protein
MTNHPQDKDGSQAIRQQSNQDTSQEASRSAGQDRQDQFQRTHERAPGDPDNNLGRGAPGDREDRIRQRAHEIWEREGRPDGKAESHWHRAAQDLDREDADLQRSRSAGVKPK